MEDTHKIPTSNKTDPRKYYTNLLYKAAFASVFLLILPILHSQEPKLVTQNRSWEFLQLLFVGLAVSYGLFSRKNNEKEKEHGATFVNAHTYLSRFLHVSSVFDEETDSPIGANDTKVQTWSNQYYREKPVLLVAQKNSVLEKQSRVNSVSVEKPLLLPIRSLKSRVLEPSETIEPTEKNFKLTRSNYNSSSNSGLKRFHSDSETFEDGEIRDFRDLEENVILRSPIPWRSRSGRIEMTEAVESPPLFSLDSETEYSLPEREYSVSEPHENHSFRPQFSHPSKSNSKNVVDLARKKISHKTEAKYSVLEPIESPSFRHQFAHPSKPNSINDEVARKKIFHKTRTPPPAPPPPPLPRHHRKPPSGKSSFLPVKETKMREIAEFESDEETKNEEIKGKKEEEIVSNGGSDFGLDVNKKADEFIAKFKEQIRLQRIESIKQIGRNSSRFV